MSVGRAPRWNGTHPRVILVVGVFVRVVSRFDQLDLVRLFPFLDDLSGQVRPPRGQQPPQGLGPASFRESERPLLGRHLDLDADPEVARCAFPPHSFVRDHDLVARLPDSPPFLTGGGLRRAETAPVEVDQDQAVEAE